MKTKEKKKHPQTGAKKSGVKRLALLNLVWLLVFVTATVTVLFLLGLLDSIFEFLF